MEELYGYVRRRIREEGAQEPMRWNLNSTGGELAISRSGRIPWMERRNRIRDRVLTLAQQGVLPNFIILKSLEVINLSPDQLTGELQRYDVLLDQLIRADVRVGDFIDQWYRVGLSTPSAAVQRQDQPSVIEARREEARPQEEKSRTEASAVVPPPPQRAPDMEPQPSPQSSPRPLVFLRAARDNLVSNQRAEISGWKKLSVRRRIAVMGFIGIIAGILAYVMGIAVYLSGQGGNGGYYYPSDGSTLPEPTIDVILATPDPQYEEAITLKIEENDKLGPILTDGEGMTLYMLDADQTGKSTCHDACAELWPPVIMRSSIVMTSPDTSAVEQVDPTLIEGIQRIDGSNQLTYNQRPLYYHEPDGTAGDIQGHQVRDAWSLWTAISPEGEPVGGETPTSAPEETAMSAPTTTTAPAENTHAGVGDSAAQGMTIAQNSGCLACHSTDGSILIGPTWQGLFGSQVTLADGSTVTASQEYLRESIVDPNAKIAEGFQPNIMPQNFGDTLSDSDIKALIAYIESLR
jgi:predicted lipoprotein with Yx(FWY)xxD motif/cytochrome c551/c552